MAPKTKKRIDKEEVSGWKEMWQIFFEGFLERAGSSIKEKAGSLMDVLRKRAIGITLLLVGVIFLLIGSVFFLNALVPVEMRWLGFIAVGAAAVGAGYYFSRK